MKNKRVSWETYFMNIATEVATRSTCDRKHVGAVIVKDKTILSTGYNGSIKGLPHCDDAGHEMVDGHCIRTTHAEANTIVQAAKNGVEIKNGEIIEVDTPSKMPPTGEIQSILEPYVSAEIITPKDYIGGIMT